MANGVFGSNAGRQAADTLSYQDESPRSEDRLRNFRERAGALSPERWVDVICGSLFLVFAVVLACTWSGFMDGLFYNVLFPVIFVGSKILAVVAIVAVAVGLISFKFRRRRYY